MTKSSTTQQFSPQPPAKPPRPRGRPPGRSRMTLSLSLSKELAGELREYAKLRRITHLSRAAEELILAALSRQPARKRP